MICPECGKKGAYVGLYVVECPHKECTYYIEQKKIRKARARWNIHGRESHGFWDSLESAQEQVRQGNEEHGDGTHWIEYG